MWVVIDSIDGDKVQGRLNNEPIHIKDLKWNDVLQFEKRNIMNTMIDDPEPNIVEKYIKRCFVTNNVLNGELKAGYLYREKPDHDDDSGWRITGGNETDEYMSDSKNAAYVSLGAVLRQDDSFVSLLDSPEGSAFRRDPSGSFKLVNK